MRNIQAIQAWVNMINGSSVSTYVHGDMGTEPMGESWSSIFGLRPSSYRLLLRYSVHRYPPYLVASSPGTDQCREYLKT